MHCVIEVARGVGIGDYQTSDAVFRTGLDNDPGIGWFLANVQYDGIWIGVDAARENGIRTAADGDGDRERAGENR